MNDARITEKRLVWTPGFVAAAMCFVSAGLVAQGIDLALSFQSAPLSATVGSQTSYVVQVSGAGASGVSITVIFTPQVTFNSSGSGAGCAANSAQGDASTTVACPWSGASVTLNVTPQVAGALNVVAGVIGNEADPNMSNNSATVSLVVSSNQAPSITGVGPSLGTVLGGQTVAISGSGLANPSSVTFGGIAATVTLNTDTLLNVITPAHAAGAVPVTVTTAHGSATLANGFTYVVVSVTSVSPNNGSTTGGRTVTINGTGFQPAITVTFGGVAATPQGTHTTTQITVTAPAHAAGAVDVTVVNAGNGGTATRTNGYTYVGPPTCTSVSVSPTPPVSTGTTLTFTPVCSGGVAPLQYLYWLYNGNTYVTNSGGYITTPWTWTPSATQTGSWSVGVWVKSVDSTNSYDTIVWTSSFTVNPAVDDAVVVSTSGIPSTMTTGQVATVSVTMKNTGNTIWTAASNYKLGDASGTPGQFGPTRELLSSAVPPNGQVTFTFNITAPATVGTYSFGWRMLQELVHWFGAYAPVGGYTISVVGPGDNASVVSTSGIPTSMAVGQSATVSITMKNIGNTTWTSAANYKIGDASGTPGQFGPTRQLLSSPVSPNGQVTFTFSITAPTTAGTYSFGWRMLVENVHWFGSYAPSGGYTITVVQPVSRLAWFAPGNTPGYTTWDPTPTDLVFAGTVTNVPTGTTITLLYVPWSTNVWQSKTATTSSTGAWFVVVPNAILTTNYSAFVAAVGIVPQSNQCWSSPDANRVTICP